ADRREYANDRKGWQDCDQESDRIGYQLVLEAVNGGEEQGCVKQTQLDDAPIVTFPCGGPNHVKHPWFNDKEALLSLRTNVKRALLRARRDYRLRGLSRPATWPSS